MIPPGPPPRPPRSSIADLHPGEFVVLKSGLDFRALADQPPGMVLSVREPRFTPELVYRPEPDRFDYGNALGVLIFLVLIAGAAIGLARLFGWG